MRDLAFLPVARPEPSHPRASVAAGYYPIFVQMTGRRVFVAGGGNVALEKIGKLVDAGAAITVVVPELIPAVRA